ncbi:MAG: alpha-L-fucosidase [Candidatus Azobacteroides sp.]|nr:alpha-L-fucosidase [Candidatus Azobacteroides sp.]
MDTNSQPQVLLEGGRFKKEIFPMSNHIPFGINEWEDLVYDLDANELDDVKITGFGLRFKFPSDSTANAVVYIDDIMLSATESGNDGFENYKPKTPQIRNMKKTGLDLTWPAFPNAISYDVYKDDVFFRNTTSTSMSVLGLDEFEVYKFHIVAKNKTGQPSFPSDGVYIQTPESEEHKNIRMAWWREARFGMFIHWGGYSAFAGRFQGKDVKGKQVDYYADGGQNGSYAEWIMYGAGIPRDTYRAKVLKDLTASNYNPKEWVRLAKEAGMKYIVVTSKHHDGLSMFNTNIGWNSVQHSAAKKDLMRELVDEARAAGLKIGFYYSQALDWTNKGGMGWMPQNYDGYGGEWPYPDQVNYVNNLVVPHLQTIIDEYNIDLIWFDMGESKYPELQYRTLKAIKSNRKAKNIIFNDRLDFKIDNGLSGDFYTPEQSIPDIPITGIAGGRDWETCMTMNNNWGYCENDNSWKSSNDLILKLIDIASKGGNFLLNIGPKADGSIPQASIDRLTEIGAWMNINGEAVYGTIANPIDKKMDWGKITRKITKDGKTILYLHVIEWPANGQLSVPLLNSVPSSASILGSNVNIVCESGNNQLIIKGLPASPISNVSTTIKLTFNAKE